MTFPYAFANVPALSTDYVLVAPINSKVTIRVLGAMLMVGGSSTNVTFNSKGSGAGTAISMTFSCSANGGAVFPIPPASPENVQSYGWFQTNPGESLTVTTGVGSAVGIQVVYEPAPLTWRD